MKIIEPSFEIISFDKEVEPLKKIELCGRTCYQSTHKIEEDSYKKFISMIMKNGHYSVMEHGNIILEMEDELYNDLLFCVDPVKDLKFFRRSDLKRKIISGNFRAWVELLKKYSGLYTFDSIRSLLEFTYPDCFNCEYFDNKHTPLNKNVFNFDILQIKDLTSEEFKIHARVTVKFIVDRGFLAEIRTHRDASFSAESTRYANYAKDQFGSEITLIKPFFFDAENEDKSYDIWKTTCETIEKNYMYLIQNNNRTPQEARSILPNSLKCEIIMTANLDEWEHVFYLRTASGAHPQMRQIMIPLKEEFIKRNYL
jgi:thymidylate synthase (FAD)